MYENFNRKWDELQDKNEIPVHDNYLGDKVLAQNLYKKKYFIKDLNSNLIERKNYGI